MLHQAVQVTKTGICAVDNPSVSCSSYNDKVYKPLKDEVCAGRLVAPSAMLKKISAAVRQYW
jgi:hypothetical protein